MKNTDAVRIALVTGGNRGIGEEVSRQLAAVGYQVVLTSRHATAGLETAVKLKGSVLSAPLDVTVDKSVHNLANFVLSRFGRVDVLINNAGVFLDNELSGRFPSIIEMDVSPLLETLDVNLCGPLRLARALFPAMRAARYGRIVNVTSGMGRLSGMEAKDDIRRDARCGSHYRISKAALNALTRILAVEGKDDNILVNAVCPGWVRTRMGTEEATRSVEEGARGIVWAATLPDGGPTGGLFRDEQQLSWQ